MTRLGKRCSDCRGVGTIPTSDINPTPMVCVPCEGTGFEPWGDVDISDIMDKLNDIKEKVDEIKEIVDAL